MSGNRVSESQIIADIRKVALLLNHSPSSVEYKRFGRYDVRTVQRNFKLPWRQIVAAAGLRYMPRTSHKIPTTEELREDICRVMRGLDHPPTRSEYQENGRFDAETVRRRSGQRKWEDALAVLVGVDREEIKLHQRKSGGYRTTREWLSRLRMLSQRLGHAPTTREANEAGINAHQLSLRVGGKWVDVLKEAGIGLSSRNRYASIRSTTTGEMIEDAAIVARRLGRPPTMREYEINGRYSSTAIRGRVGGWRQLKKILAERLEKRRVTERCNVQATSLQRDLRCN